MAFVKDRDEPIYTISIAAKLVRPAARGGGRAAEAAKPIHAQTLRMYDRLGLVRPRKVGKNRFYSDRDIERLQQIQHFTQDIGINLAGVAYIFALLDQMRQAETTLERIEAMLRQAEDRVREAALTQTQEDQQEDHDEE
jgi:MerR family transcriptional regulator/heat shock protein HspR